MPSRMGMRSRSSGGAAWRHSSMAGAARSTTLSSPSHQWGRSAFNE
ncbi:MAG: hypothetical protein FWG14_00960 [Peptococcaceae bacterium]|nr:hypothetical protein [Peptococcaceae bacterium]